MLKKDAPSSMVKRDAQSYGLRGCGVSFAIKQSRIVLVVTTHSYIFQKKSEIKSSLREGESPSAHYLKKNFPLIGDNTLARIKIGKPG